jgi:hypothetical protein
MSGPMYFKPTPSDIADAEASDCPMATPRDSRNCEGSRCGAWNLAENKPCQGYYDRAAAKVAQQGQTKGSANTLIGGDGQLDDNDIDGDAAVPAYHGL